MNRIETAIAGASGYTGIELLRLLLGHLGVELAINILSFVYILSVILNWSF